jgi:hypothetical protein
MVFTVRSTNKHCMGSNMGKGLSLNIELYELFSH